MIVAVSEYDAFGPWIYEIDEEHPMPKLFVPHIPQDEAALMLFKIPRNIERRLATPDMDLYDYIIGAYSNHICILKREERTVAKTMVSYSEIEGLELKRHFLAGSLTVYVKKTSITVPFNAVSMDMIKRFTAHIRSRILKEQNIIPEVVREKQADIPLNLLFTNMLRDLRDDGETPLLYGYQPTAVCTPVNRSGLQGLLDRFRHQKNPATLHVVTPGELIIIQQDVTTEKHAKEEFTYHYFYLPVSEIKKAVFEKSADCEEQLLVVSLADHSFSFKIKEGNDSIRAVYAILRNYTGRRK